MRIIYARLLMSVILTAFVLCACGNKQDALYPDGEEYSEAEVLAEQESVILEEIGVTLILPDSWKGKYEVIEGVFEPYKSTMREFCVKSIYEAQTSTDGSGQVLYRGTLFTIFQYTDYFMSEEEFEQSGIAGIGRYLFATENATYALMYTTDVQYDRNNAGQKEEWNAMEQSIKDIQFVVEASQETEDLLPETAGEAMQHTWLAGLKGVDLNGNGVAGDSLVVENVEGVSERYNLLTVVLDSVENVFYPFPYSTDAMEDMISVAAAPLIDPNRNSIVIEITNSTSNFGASDFLVLSVLRNVDGSILIREDLAITWGDDSVIAERYENIRLVLEETLTITPEENMVTYTEVNGQDRYAIVVRAYPEGYCLYVYWDGSAWKVCFSAIGCANTSESDEQ